MADVPKVFPLTGVTVSTDFGTVPADKVWLIKSVAIYNTAGSAGLWALRVGGDNISTQQTAFTGTDQSRDLVKDGAAVTGANDNVMAEAAEVVRLQEIVDGATVNARLSVVEIDA